MNFMNVVSAYISALVNTIELFMGNQGYYYSAKRASVQIWL